MKVFLIVLQLAVGWCVPSAGVSVAQSCNFTGAWTTDDPKAPVCEAKAWGCQTDGAQFWLMSDDKGGFRGVAHGPADYQHSGHGPYQMGWSHANASISEKSGGICIRTDANPATDSCGNVSQTCDQIVWHTGTLSQNASTAVWVRETPVHTVHLIFTTHFDAGCAASIIPVLQEYFSNYIPQVLSLQEGMRSMGYTEEFHFLFQPWLVQLYVDCPPHLKLDVSEFGNPTELICPTAEEVRRFEAALRRGDVVLQASPANLQPEGMDAALFEGGLELSRELCERYNRSRAECGSVLSGRDVPGLTRAILPLLQKHQVLGITVGTNGCVEPAFPWADGQIQSGSPFLWRDEASGAEIVTMIQQDYGPQLLDRRARTWVLPNGHALAFQFMSDNAGTVSSIGEVMGYFDMLRSSFPGAKVIGSSLDAFYQEAVKVKSSLPVVTGEIGDVWIQGTASDPHKTAEFNAISRARTACVLRGDEYCSMKNPEFRNHTQLLLKYPEHTWGMAGYVDGQIDVTKWANRDFHAARDVNDPHYAYAEQTWAEQRRFNLFAVEAVNKSSRLAKEIEENLAELQPQRPSLDGLTQRASLTDALHCGDISLQFDGTTGSISSLVVDGDDWAAESSLAALSYVTYNLSDFIWYHSSSAWGCGSNVCPCQHCQHGFDKFNSSCPVPGLDISQSDTCANPEDRRYLPKMIALHSDGKCRAAVQLAFPRSTHTDYGAPADIWLDVQIGNAEVDIKLTLWNKTATRLAEAAFFSFTQKPRQGSEWSIGKLASWINPSDVVNNGNQYQHGVTNGLRYGTMTIESLDSNLAATITDEPAIAEICPGESGGEVSCKDILCTWQGTPTALPGGGTRAASLTPKSPSSIQGFGYNLHNNMWSINYPNWTPYRGYKSGDENYLFRFKMKFGAKEPSTAPDKATFV